MKADDHFPICVSGCGRRGKGTVWYQISKNARFGECVYCYRERMDRMEKVERAGGPGWDPPVEDPGPDTGPTGPWIV